MSVGHSATYSLPRLIDFRRRFFIPDAIADLVRKKSAPKIKMDDAKIDDDAAAAAQLRV